MPDITYLLLLAAITLLFFLLRQEKQDHKETRGKLATLEEKLGEDHLTGLGNRHRLKQRFVQAHARARRDARDRLDTDQLIELAVVYIDLDKFKEINDIYGHLYADSLLKKLAEQLQRSARRGQDIVTRVGGDEFIIVLVGPFTRDQLENRVQVLHSVFNQQITVGMHSVHVFASMGVALFQGDGGSPKSLINRADAAMYAAKSRGSAKVVWDPPEFNPSRSEP